MVRPIILKKAVELVNPPNRLLSSNFSCFSWSPTWCPENADVVQLQCARCDGMAHAISSLVQRSRWAAAAFFRINATPWRWPAPPSDDAGLGTSDEWDRLHRGWSASDALGEGERGEHVVGGRLVAAEVQASAHGARLPGEEGEPMRARSAKFRLVCEIVCGGHFLPFSKGT